MLSRLLLNVRTLGFLLIALGLYLASSERELIVRTGHAGRKSAALPYIVCMGIAFAADPNFRRPFIAGTMLVLGLAGGVAWFFLWE